MIPKEYLSPGVLEEGKTCSLKVFNNFLFLVHIEIKALFSH